MCNAIVIASAWQDFSSGFRRIWDFHLFKIGQTQIVVSQIVVGLLVLVLGIWLSRWSTKQVYRWLLRRFYMDPSAAAAVRRLLLYTLLAIVAVIALQMVNVPLSSLAFLGGALAIGIGFGAQNIFNNFISGLILMIERPVRIGDIVEVESTIGRVEEVRYRSTRIRRLDGVDMLVPNSTLLEKNVVNWTLTDRRVRTSVKVGIAYGSNVRLARELLLQVAAGDGRVLPDPAPVVVFDDFGNSSLDFEVYFWVEISTIMDMRLLRSDMRFRIDELFAKSGLVIAFPQRDVHLDAVKPLEVQVVQR